MEKTYALTLSVIITRWGTQYRLIHSLLQSKDALRRYGTRNNLDHEKSNEGKGSHVKMIDIIMNHNFWHDLKDIIEILKPLHDYQVMLEFGNVHLGYVVKKNGKLLSFIFDLYAMVLTFSDCVR